MSKRSKIRDPNYAAEAAKYENPIPSREYILEYFKKKGLPMMYEDLCEPLGLVEDDQQEALRRRLRAMEREGQLVRNRRGAYGLVDKMDLKKGKVQGHADGFGFLIPEDGSEDLYLNARQMRMVFHGDEALARISGLDRRGRPEGIIVEVLKHNTEQVVGRYYHDQGVGRVVPDNPRLGHEILVHESAAKKAKSGQYVTVAITGQPGQHNRPAGKIVEILGDHLTPGVEVEVAIRSYGIPHTWSPEVMREAKQFGKEPTAKDKEKRVDLRQLPLVTIDGEDARDFDDAVYCERVRSGGWRLYVAIADVAHYVQIDSELDKEAVIRANSVYFPNHVVPMLPEVLSNGLCSLNSDVDRLAIVCEMNISAAGKLTRYRFFEAVICSKARLTYTQVARALQEAPEEAPIKADLLPHLHNLHALYKCLKMAREQRGAIDFDTVETRVIFDRHKKIESIVPVVRNDAHRLIEECMLCANVAAARFLQKYKLEGLYRVHLGPNPKKLTNLRAYLGEVGQYLAGGEEPTPEDYQGLMQRIAERPDAQVIQTVMLRSLSQAVYQPQNEGHFGLNYPAYAHFTSPIRRYPDLLTHRAIRYLIRSGQVSAYIQKMLGSRKSSKKATFPYGVKEMLQLGEHCSMAERRADEATRDVLARLKCEYLRNHIGSEFDGVITGVTSFGLFVELQDLYVEGLLHVSALQNDYYHFDAAKHRLLGERSGQSFSLGDAVRVLVARADPDDRKIDLEWVPSAGRRSKRAATAKSGRQHGKHSPGKSDSSKGDSSKGDPEKNNPSKSVAGKNSPSKPGQGSRRRRAGNESTDNSGVATVVSSKKNPHSDRKKRSRGKK